MPEIEITSIHESDWYRYTQPPMAGGAASASDYLENALLNAAVTNDGAFTSVQTYLALCETVPTDATVGTALVEADYTGYARGTLLAASFSAAASGSKTNSAAITFAPCTAGDSTIVGFAIVDSATTAAGNIHFWGTTTSTLISTTQSPATVAIGGLVVAAD